MANPEVGRPTPVQPITVRTWAKVLVFGGVTTAALMVVLGVVLPFLVLDTPHGFGIHPFLENNPTSSPGKDMYSRVVAGLFAWLGGVYVGIRTAGIHGWRERGLAGLGIAGVVAVLFVADGLLADAARAREAEPPKPRNLPALVSGRTPLATCGDDALDPNGDPIAVENHQCLLDAFLAGKSAEFVIYEKASGQVVEQIIRVLPDATIEVFVHRGTDDTAGWERYSCAALRPASAPQIFERVGCTQPVAVPARR